MRIDIKIEDCEFKAEVKCGIPHIFEVGERILADKLFYILTGLSKEYQGSIETDDIDFSHSADNTVLALGDATMFINGTVKKNLHKALKLRRKDFKEKTIEALETYNLDGNKKIKHLSDEELLRLSLARAHYRKIDLIVAHCCETFVKPEDLDKFCNLPYALIII